jgi:hypothetical protein
VSSLQGLDTPDARIDQRALRINDVDIAETATSKSVSHEPHCFLGSWQNFGIDTISFGYARNDTSIQASQLSTLVRPRGSNISFYCKALRPRPVNISAICVIYSERYRATHDKRYVVPQPQIPDPAPKRNIWNGARFLEPYARIRDVPLRFQERNICAIGRERELPAVDILEL